MKFRDQPDELVLAAIRAGEEAAWMELVERHHRRAFLLTRRRLDGDTELAEEVVQTAWVQVITRLQEGRPIDHFARFFTTLLVRRCIDEQRRKRRQPPGYSLQAPLGSDDADATREDLLPAPDAGALAELLRAEEQSAVRVALERLSERDRAVLLARTEHELSNRDTAAFLLAQGLVEPGGNLEKKVENYYYRALERLERELGRRSPDAG